MLELEISDIGAIINAAPLAMNLIFIGDTGIGKTTVIEKYAEENKYFLKTLILSQIEASESLGLPIKYDKEFNGKSYPCMTQAIPEWVFELAQYDKAILFLDEFLCAQPSVMNAFLNFLTQKKVGNIDLSHVRIVAATNVGNYTFEPDNNILSRFCWFYTVNTKVNNFLNDSRIINNYKDENVKSGPIFEIRSLKPRCQELLKSVETEYLNVFYQGFTNKQYIVVHSNSEINEVISSYFQYESINKFSISDENFNSMIMVMKKAFSRFRKWDKVFSEFVNLDLETVLKIKKAINEGVSIDD